MTNDYFKKGSVFAAIFLTQLALASLCCSQDLGFGAILQTDSRNNLISKIPDPDSSARSLIVKINAKDGTTAWQIAPEKDFSFNYHLVNKNGDVFVLMGGLHNTAQQGEVFLSKYRGTDGSFLWKSVIESANYDVYPFLDKKGDVIIYLGSTQVFIKYSGVNGSILFKNMDFER